MGIRLYYLLRAVYEANQKLDASCCSILFCKAMELQMQECFGNSLKRLLPDAKMSGRGTLGKTEISRLTLGNFHFLIGKNSGMLAARMAERGESRYDADWWRQYERRLKKCAGQRKSVLPFRTVYLAGPENSDSGNFPGRKRKGREDERASL